jgi:hypothetical protein
MSHAARARALVDRRHRHVGDGLSVTLRRRSTLRHKVTNAPITALVLAAAASGGASVVDLTATSLLGELVAGSQVTIAAVVYTTTNSVKANDAEQLIGVAITPVLAAPASQGAAASVTRSYSEQLYTAMRSELVTEGLDGWVEGASLSYRLSAGDAVRAPEKGDLVYDGSERVEAVKRVRELEPGVGVIGWQIWVGAGT